MRTRYLVCYDIADPGRLRRVARICEGFGTRLQFSVFETALDGLSLQKLKTQLVEVIHAELDQVLVVTLGPETSSKAAPIDVLGRAMEPRARVTVV